MCDAETRVCKKCNVKKTESDFYKQNKSKCKSCIAEYGRDRWLRNKDEMSLINKAWRKINAEQVRRQIYEWRIKNPNAYHAINKKSRTKHCGRVMASNGKRRAVEKSATPSWANMFFIAEAYSLARLRTKLTGIKWHVDHIVPLKSEKVCGFHVENNLQVILAAHNVKKNNKYWPNMQE